MSTTEHDTASGSSKAMFEYVKTPENKPPTFEKWEDCGVRTTKVCFFGF